MQLKVLFSHFVWPICMKLSKKTRKNLLLCTYADRSKAFRCSCRMYGTRNSLDRGSKICHRHFCKFDKLIEFHAYKKIQFHIIWQICIYHKSVKTNLLLLTYADHLSGESFWLLLFEECLVQEIVWSILFSFYC